MYQVKDLLRGIRAMSGASGFEPEIRVAPNGEIILHTRYRYSFSATDSEEETELIPMEEVTV